jgi:hypothetical protein
MAFVRGDEEKTIQVFGYNGAVSDSTETIWPTGGFITINAAGAPQTITCVSAGGATDSGVKVTLEGLDGSYLLASEEVTLGSDGTVATSGTWGRINRAWVSGSTNLTGNCTIKTTTSNTTLQVLMIDTNTTGNATYTVPMDYDGYLDSISCNASVDTDIKLVISIMEYDASAFAYLVKDKSRTINFRNSYQRQFIKPVKIPRGSTVELQAIAGATTGISADFVMLLDKV